MLICCEFTRQTLAQSEVQLDFTPDMEVLYMLFERCHTKNRKRSLKQHMMYSNSGMKFSWTTL